MFCFCGTILDIPTVGNEVMCQRCGARIELNEETPVVMSKTFESTNKVDIKKAKGAKIKQQCPMCNSEEMSYSTVQMRSADEGQTIFYECDCGYRMKLNS
jgi:DNA-directed RNA polymerase I subunit RPA12